jgi:hypothetical protein
MKDIVLVIPTIRENCFNDFVDRWHAIGLFDHVDLMVMEDNPAKTFQVVQKAAGQTVYHFSWEDIKADMGDTEWVIPRRSDTVRSYAYYKAWKEGYKYILTLDDDCYPPSDVDGLKYSGAGFVNEHLKQIKNRSRWFNTLNSVKPRGIPFYNVGKADNVIVNHGLWTNVLDYDAPYQLANPIPEQFSFDNRVVPSGLYFPMCGMNVMWRADATVLMYHLLMGRRKSMLDGVQGLDKDGLVKLPFDRFGDIWCGILMKKVADSMGYMVTTGMPYIRHERASNPFTNLKKEANGIEVNEDFWEFVDKVDLSGAKSLPMAYRFLGLLMEEFTTKYPKYKEHEEYFVLLSKAMVQWADLFKE